MLGKMTQMMITARCAMPLNSWWTWLWSNPRFYHCRLWRSSWRSFLHGHRSARRRRHLIVLKKILLKTSPRKSSNLAKLVAICYSRNLLKSWKSSPGAGNPTDRCHWYLNKTQRICPWIQARLPVLVTSFCFMKNIYRLRSQTSVGQMIWKLLNLVKS